MASRKGWTAHVGVRDSNPLIPRDSIEPQGFMEYDIDSQGGVELDAYIPPDVQEDGDEASNVD